MSKERDRQDSRNNGKSSRNHDYLIKLRGISNSTNKDEIKDLLYPCRIDTIHLFNNRGNTTGECLVDLESEADVKDALKKSNQYLGSKHVEIFRATVYEYNFFMKHKGMISWREPVIRMSGLPYTCTMGDVQNFFKDITIARNGIYITRDMTDNALGGGYVAFINMEHAYKAIDIYDQKHIQHRYIQLTPSTYDEAKKTIMNDAHLNGKQFSGESDDEDNRDNTNNDSVHKQTNRSKRRSRSTSCDHRHRPVRTRRSRSHQSRNNVRRSSRSRSPVHRSPRPSNRNQQYLVKMRGMPYTVTEKNIQEFFPSSCQPVRMEILYDRRTKRPNGDAYVYFNTMDQVNEAVKCDRKYMGNRYVEIYFDSRRPLATDRQHSKSDRSSHHSSRSPSKAKHHNHSRSRTISSDKSD